MRPPAGEMAMHPTDGNQGCEYYLKTDDIEAPSPT
ncbi:hypothetical protein BH18CHL1_BH18CHL1_04940 [soil metagenome]